PTEASGLNALRRSRKRSSGPCASAAGAAAAMATKAEVTSASLRGTGRGRIGIFLMGGGGRWCASAGGHRVKRRPAQPEKEEPQRGPGLGGDLALDRRGSAPDRARRV